MICLPRFMNSTSNQNVVRKLVSKRAWLVDQCEEREITFKSNKPTLIQLITKLVFHDSLADSRRVNSYARVLNAAAQSYKVLVASDVPEFIRANGGIEEVSAATAKNTKSPSNVQKLVDNCLLKEKKSKLLLMKSLKSMQ